MRCVVYTEDNYLELGMRAKDAFLKCLPPDEDGKFDAIQVMTPEINSKISKLTDDDYGMSWNKEDSYAKKAARVMIDVPFGKKFLITQDWQGDKMMIEGVCRLNEGMTLSEMIHWFNSEKKKLRNVGAAISIVGN